MKNAAKVETITEGNGWAKILTFHGTRGVLHMVAVNKTLPVNVGDMIRIFDRPAPKTNCHVSREVEVNGKWLRA